jgi:hypothetical protein
LKFAFIGTQYNLNATSPIPKNKIKCTTTILKNKEVGRAGQIGKKMQKEI